MKTNVWFKYKDLNYSIYYAINYGLKYEYCVFMTITSEPVYDQ